MMAFWHSMLREVAKEDRTPHSCTCETINKETNLVTYCIIVTCFRLTGTFSFEVPLIASHCHGLDYKGLCLRTTVSLRA